MKTFLALLLRAESIVAVIAYLVVAALLLGEIVAREVFSTSIWGSQQIAIFAAIVAAFMGLALATAANGHLRPQFADYWWPQDWHPQMARIGDLLSSLIYMALTVIAGMYISDTYINDDRAAVLYWSLWPIQLVIPYAFLSSSLRHLAFAIWPDMKPQASVEG